MKSRAENILLPVCVLRSMTSKLFIIFSIRRTLRTVCRVLITSARRISIRYTRVMGFYNLLPFTGSRVAFEFRQVFVPIVLNRHIMLSGPTQPMPLYGVFAADGRAFLVCVARTSRKRTSVSICTISRIRAV